MAETLAFVTAAAPNYLAQVRVLAASLRRFHPAIPFYAFLSGDPACEREVRDLGLGTLDLRDLSLPGLTGMLLRYGPKEFCAAVKPALLLAVLRRGHRCAIFLDPDMLVLDTLLPCLSEASSHPLTVTPHLDLEGTTCGGEAFERPLLMAGMFNGGFVAAADQPEAIRFLAWWQDRLRTQCYEDPAAGIHFDQRWLDLAPGYVAGLHILRDPGINAGYWRLPQLARDSRTGAFRVAGSPLRLFHFSGYDPARPDEITRFHPAWRVAALGPGAELFQQYQRRLLEEGWRQHSRRPWPWGEAWRAAHAFRRLRRACRTLLAAARGR